MTVIRPVFFIVFLMIASSCARTGQSVMAPVAQPSTQYRVGDFVVYSYTGEALPQPVELREEIVQRDGLRLEIQIQARRGKEVRRWIQVVTDTPENQANNVIDELYELIGSERRLLANNDNRDAYRLYEWTFPPTIKGRGGRTSFSRTVSIEGQPMQADCQRMPVAAGETPAIMENCTSRAFLWTNIFGHLYRESDNTTLWQVSVETYGPTRKR
jgi:hypothetical protein